VDLPGEAVVAVVIDKIPFPAPGDPVRDALAERAEKRCELLARLCGERGERIRVLRALLEVACEGEVAGEAEPDDTGADSWT
jgi:Rad3-related DNA helicase